MVSSIKLKKSFCKVYDMDSLVKKFLIKQFIERVKVSNMSSCSRKTNELRDIDSI